VKRLQIMIEEDLDAALERMALEEGTSKAALIRRFVREHVQPLPPLEEDPIWQMVGAIDVEPADIDEVVYGPAEGPEP
jgi:hypothetical protein